MHHHDEAFVGVCTKQMCSLTSGEQAQGICTALQYIVMLFPHTFYLKHLQLLWFGCCILPFFLNCIIMDNAHQPLRPFPHSSAASVMVIHLSKPLFNKHVYFTWGGADRLGGRAATGQPNKPRDSAAASAEVPLCLPARQRLTICRVISDAGCFLQINHEKTTATTH